MLYFLLFSSPRSIPSRRRGRECSLLKVDLDVDVNAGASGR